ncbi:hypothetical protein [Flavobacterium marginilacus]|uniref:hypothetical protein n=1 Tax=Flavobacterium marginilacus TaxID=3003256 RepID=UPI00248E5588|nr:hypothetical protein [Flavobacterium marginilacus]
MKEFLELNKPKLPFAFKITSILCLSVYSIFLILAKFNQNQFPSINLLLLILMIAGFLFPILILLTAYLHWENEKRYYKKFIIAKTDKNENSFGYSEKLMNQDSKCFFATKILSKNIKSFEVEIKFEYKEIAFYICAINKDIENAKLKYFEKKLKELNFENFIFRVFVLKIKRKEFDENSLKDIEIKLVKLVNLFEEYDYKPEK